MVFKTKCSIADNKLMKEWHFSKNSHLNPYEVNTGSHKKVWWQCENGHEWETSPSNRSQGSGCPYCANQKVWKGFNDLTTTHPELAKEWHPTKNGSLIPEEIVAGSNKKVWWQCKKGHEWQAVISSRKKGNKCPYCSNQKAWKGDNDLATTHPHLLKEWHPTKNLGITPYEIVAGSGLRVWWRCERGHEWSVAVRNRTSGASGCPYCSGRLTIKGETDLATCHPELIKEWHPTKNGKLKPTDVTSSSSKKVWWLCDEGHEWEATVGSRSKRAGCPVCVNRRVSKGFNDLSTTNPELAKEWHPTKNGDLTPQDVVAGSVARVWWKCEKGHEWETALVYRLNGTGCPHCSSTGTSYPEQCILYYLTQIFLETKSRHKIEVEKKNIEIDVYIPELSLGIEYDGVYWHKDREIEDLKKNNSLNSKIELIRIRELGLNQIEGSYCIFTKGNGNELEEAIKNVFQFIVENYELEKSVLREIENLEINIQKDDIRITEFYKSKLLKNSLASSNPQLIMEWHPTKNGSLKPENFSPGSCQRVWWKCERGHEWIASIRDRVANKGCPYCAGNKVWEGWNDLTTTHPELVSEWHPVKNGRLTPSKISAGSGRGVWWKCEYGHEWKTTISNKLKSKGCPFCGNKKVLKGFNDLNTTHPELSNEWDFDKNNGVTPFNVVAGSSKKVWWRCEYGHEWKTSVVHRVYGTGCPYCSNKKTLAGFNDLATTHPELAKQWHFVKNGELTPQNVSSGSGKKVWWQCEHGYEWEAKVITRTKAKQISCPCYRNKTKKQPK